jgi:PadR family transcriptional regulator, regulatory protein PadR
MPRNNVPNTRELCLLGILIAGEKYGLQLREEYEVASRDRMPLGSLYVTLDRLEVAGFVRSRIGESVAANGGNRRKYFVLTAAGRRAFDAATAQFQQARAMGGLND